MLYKALQLAMAAHADQTDKQGEAYIFHLLAVMHNLGSEATEEEKVVALLHDIVEDTAIRIPEIYEEFGSEVAFAVAAMTKSSSENYNNYMHRVKSNELARKVKIADLKHNTHISRSLLNTEKDFNRMQKYASAYKFLVEE